MTRGDDSNNHSVKFNFNTNGDVKQEENMEGTWTGIKVFTTVAVNLLTFAFGMTVGITPLLLKQLEEHFMPEKEQLSWIASVPALGAIVGVILCGIVSARLGRKSTLLLSAVLDIIGWVLIASAVNVHMAIVGRLLNGVALGTGILCAKLYLSDTFLFPTNKVTSVTITLSLGVSTGTALGCFVLWRIVCGVAAAFPLFFILVCYCTPATPQWVYKKKGAIEAEDVLRKMKFQNVQQQIDNIVKAKTGSRDPSNNLWSSASSYLTTLVILLGLVILRELCGNSVLLNYSYDILSTVTHERADPKLVIIALCVGRSLVQIIFIATLERCRRTPLLIASSLIASFCLIGISVYHYLDPYLSDVLRMYFIPVISIGVFTFIYNAGVELIPDWWITDPETFPKAFRSLYMSIIYIVQYCFMFVVLKAYSCTSEAIGDYGVFCFFSAASFAVFLYTVIFISRPKNEEELKNIEQWEKDCLRESGV